jgi:exopolysaccharide biosynthesis polyprenyl glycosylphosphotransferase
MDHRARLELVARPALGAEAPVPLEGRRGPVDHASTVPMETERALSTTWPAGAALRRASGLAMAAALAVPLVSRELSVSAVLALMLAVGLGTVAARLVFEALASFRAGSLHLLAALLAAAPAAAVVQVAGRLAGQDPPTTLALAGVAAPAAMLVLASALRRHEVRRQAARRRVFFVGAIDQVDDFVREIGHSPRLKLVGSEWLDGRRRRPLDRETLLSRVAETQANTIVLSERALEDRGLADVAASRLNLCGLRVRSLAAFYEEEFGKVATSELSSSWFLFDVAEIHGGVYRAAKRLLETFIALALLLSFAPFVPAIALAIRWSSAGPVLFRNDRVAKNGSVFTLLKFRTMEQDPDADQAWAGGLNERVFPVGRFLRRYRLDEIPQLWNIVRGDLSAVGPRPEQPAIVERLEDTIPFYGKRHSVRPGLTGWAQVNFGYGGSETGSLTKLQYDLYYIKHQSLRFDWSILLATVRTVIGGTGG